MRFYHNEPKWPGTLKAIPSGVLQPNVVVCVSSCREERVSHRGWGGYARCTCDSPRFDGPLDYRSRRPGKGVADASLDLDVSQQLTESFVPTVSCHARSRPRSLRPTHRLVHRRSRCVWYRFLLDPWDLGRFYPPKTRLGQGAVRTLPIPADSTRFVAFCHQNRHDLFHNPCLVPSLKPIVDGAFGTEFFRQLVPLATAPHPKNYRIEHLPPFRHRSSSLLTRPKLCKDRLDSLPKCVGNFPDYTQLNFLLPFSSFSHSWSSIIECPRMTYHIITFKERSVFG